MAIAKLGAVVAGISGSLTGVTFANTRHGLSLKKPKPPRPPSSDGQRIATRAMTAARAAWPLLTELERDAWRTFAANTPMPNRLGVPRNLTGHQMFIRFNWMNRALGLALISDPPPQWPFSWPQDFILTATAGASIIIGPTPAFLPGGRTLLVRGARPMTTHPIRHMPRWNIITVETTPFGGLVDVLAAFQARYGTIQAGERIGIEIRRLDVATPDFRWLRQLTTVL